MADLATKNTTADLQNKQSKDLARQSQLCTENRDLALGTENRAEPQSYQRGSHSAK